MNKIKFTLVMYITLLFALIGIGCNNESAARGNDNKNDNKTVSNTAENPSGYNGPLQGSVVSEGIESLSKSDDLEISIINASLGKLRLEFPVSNETGAKQIEVPSEAMTELNSYYRDYLRFCSTPTGDATNINERLEREKKISKAAFKTENELTNVEIDAPDGRRKVSWIEAGNLIKFVGLSASNQCEKLK
jgi:hypothetical protein